MKPIFINPQLRKEQGLLSLKEMASYLNVSNTTVTAYRDAGNLPPPVIVSESGRVKLWSFEDISEFRRTNQDGFCNDNLVIANKFHALRPLRVEKNRCGKANKAHLGRVKVDGEW